MSTTTMTRNQMRVAIAQDVLDQIAVGKFLPQKGTYFSLPTGGDATKALCKLSAKQTVPTCEVCGLGAVFTSAIHLFNELPKDMRHSQDDGAMKRRLSPFFTIEELSRIEQFFEGWQKHNLFRTYPHLTQWVSWSDLFLGSGDRLVLMMSSIVQNNGELDWNDPVFH
jgi:hypothetical protein